MWKGYDKQHDLVFSTARELGDQLHLHDLEGLYTTLAVSYGGNIAPPAARDMDPDSMVRYIYSWTKKHAKPPSEQGSRMDTETLEVNELDEAAKADEAAAKASKGKAKSASPKPAKAPTEAKDKVPTHKVYRNDQTITRLLDTPPIASGSNRYRNMATVMASATVGEALLALRALTPKGVPADIDLAVEKQAVEIK
jgi:hypothetical protein